MAKTCDLCNKKIDIHYYYGVYEDSTIRTCQKCYNSTARKMILRGVFIRFCIIIVTIYLIRATCFNESFSNNYEIITGVLGFILNFVLFGTIISILFILNNYPKYKKRAEYW